MKKFFNKYAQWSLRHSGMVKVAQQQEVVVELDAHGLSLLLLRDGQLVQAGYFPIAGRAGAASMLEDLVQEYGLQGQATRLVLGHSDYRLLLVQRPDVPEPELVGALRWSLGDRLPAAADACELRCFAPPGDAAAKQLYVAAVPNAMLDTLAGIVTSAGLRLAKIYIRDLALAALLGPVAGDAPAGLLHVDDQGASLVLVGDGQFLLGRQLNWTSDEIEQKSERLAASLAGALQFSSQRLNFVVDQFWVVSAPDHGAMITAALGAAGIEQQRMLPSPHNLVVNNPDILATSAAALGAAFMPQSV